MYQSVTVTAPPGIVVIRVSMEEGDIVDVVAGSAANEAVLASRQSVVTISVRFMGVSFPV